MKNKTITESKPIQKIKLFQSVKEVGNILSQQYTIDIIFLLSSEPMRFKQIRKELKISDNTLSRRLKSLIRVGVVKKLSVSFGTRKGHEYTVTDLGQELIRFFMNYEKKKNKNYGDE